MRINQFSNIFLFLHFLQSLKKFQAESLMHLGANSIHQSSIRDHQ
jgi:hypothetical protein